MLVNAYEIEDKELESTHSLANLLKARKVYRLLNYLNSLADNSEEFVDIESEAKMKKSAFVPRLGDEKRSAFIPRIGRSFYLNEQMTDSNSGENKRALFMPRVGK